MRRSDDSVSQDVSHPRIALVDQHLFVAPGNTALFALCLHQDKQSSAVLDAHLSLLQQKTPWLPIPRGKHIDAMLPPDTLNVDELQAWAIRKALVIAQGNYSKAAPLLGMHRTTLAMYLQKHPEFIWKEETEEEETQPLLTVVK